METIANVLKRRLNKLGLSKTLQAARIIAAANQASQGRYRAVRFSRGSLTVLCPNSVTAQEVQINHRNIINNLNNRLGDNTVTRLSFRIEN